jgi:hypothetical protein
VADAAVRPDLSQVSIKLDGLWKPPPTRRKTGLAPVLAAPLHADRQLDPAGVASLRSRYRKTASRLAALPGSQPEEGTASGIFKGLNRLRDTGRSIFPSGVDLSLSVGMSSPVATWLARFPRGAALGGTLALFLVVWLIWPAEQTPDSTVVRSQASLRSTLLRISAGATRAFVKTARTSGDPAVPGAVLQVGEEVWTAPGGSATLTDVAGDVVELAAESQLAIARVERGSMRFRVEYLLERLSGRLAFDFHAQPRVTLNMGAATLTLVHARARLDVSRNGRLLVLLDGSATLEVTGARTTTLGRGEHVLP